MKKIFSLIVGLLCAVGTTYADNVTLGRNVELDATKTDYTLVGAENATVTLSDGTGKTATNKALYYCSSSSVKMNCTCYRSCDKAGKVLAEYNADCYAGFQVVLTEGYKIDISQINVKIAAGNNFSYRVAIIKDGKAVYTSSDYTIANFNNDSTLKSGLNLN